MGAGLDVCGREPVGHFLQSYRVGTGAEGVAALLEADALFAQAAGEPLVAVETGARVEGEVGADPQEHAAEVLVLEVEVVLPDEAVAELDVIALARKADGHAGVLAALEDHGDAVLALQVLIVGLDPVLAPNVFGRLDDLQVSLFGEALDEVMVIVGNGPEVGRGQLGRQPFLLEVADDRGRVLQNLDDGVEKDAIKAGVVEADGLLMVLDEGVHGGPRGLMCGYQPPIIARSARIWGFQGAWPLA